MGHVSRVIGGSWVMDHKEHGSYGVMWDVGHRVIGVMGHKDHGS